MSMSFKISHTNKQVEISVAECWEHLNRFANAVANPGGLHESIKRDPVFGPKLMPLQRELLSIIVENYTFHMAEKKISGDEAITKIAKLQSQIHDIFGEYVNEIGAMACVALQILPVEETLHIGEGANVEEMSSQEVQNFLSQGSELDANNVNEVRKVLEETNHAGVLIKPHEDVALIIEAGYRLYGGAEAFAVAQVEVLNGLSQEIRESSAGLAASIVGPILQIMMVNANKHENRLVNAIATIELVDLAFKSSGINYLPDHVGHPVEKFGLLCGMGKGNIEMALGMPSSFPGHHEGEDETEAQMEEALAKASGFVMPGNGTIN